MKRYFLVQALMFFIVIEELPCSTPRNQCPYKKIKGCTTVSVVKPGCRYNYVYPQTEYTAAINIKSCIPRNLLRIYWTVRNNGKRFFTFKCRQKSECSLQNNKINGSFFVMEARLFVLDTTATKKLQLILVPISFTKLSLTTVKDLVSRKLMKVTDAIKMFEYMLPSLNTKSSNSIVVRNRLISKIRIYLQNQSVGSTTQNTNPGTWIPIGRPNNSSNISVLVVPSETHTSGDAISNGIKVLLTKENLTEAHLAKLTRIVHLMAESIMGQVQSNPKYDREKINSQIQNRTIQIWELLKKMNRTEHKTHPKMFTEAHWSEWGNWSPCSKTCKGRKFSTRSRTCFVNEDTYKPCKGHSSEMKKCPCLEEVLPPKPTGPTVIYGQWTSWGSWSECSVTCGLGNEQSYRKCQSNQREFKHGDTIIKCVGSRKKTRACIMAACGATKAEYKIFQGSNASLTCKSLDQSVHRSMYWVSPRGKRYRPGRKIGRISVTKDGQLHIKRAYVDDEGTYYCIIPVSNRNIIGNAQIMILTCQDDPCMNGGTCIERKYEIITKPSSFVCLCASGYYGTFCEKKSKQLRAFLIIIPVCAGLVLMICIISMAALRLKKTKRDSFQEKTAKWNKKDRIRSSYSKENAKLNKKSSKETSKENKSKLNKSVVSGDDSLQEIEEKDIEHILSPQKSRKTNVSYKRQSVRDPVQRNVFVKTNPGKDKAYPSTPEELQNWYMSPQGNAEYYNSPMDINVYENVSSIGATSKEPLYDNIPQKNHNTVNQRDLKMKPARSMKMDDKDYEDMYLPFAEGGQIQSPNTRDFTLIHKSLTPSRNTTRSFPDADIQFSDDRNRSNILDEPLFQEKNMSNINAETEKYCHPSDICGRQSLKLNLRNVIQSISQEDILEPSHPENSNSGLTYQRFQQKVKYNASKESQFDYVLDFHNSGSESIGTKNEKFNPKVKDKIKRSAYNQTMSTKSKNTATRNHYTPEIRDRTSTPLQKQSKEDAGVMWRQDFQQLQKNLYAVPTSKRLQSSALSSSDTQMRNAYRRFDEKEKVVLSNQKGSKSFNDINSDEDLDIVYHRKYLKKKNRQESMIDDEADGITSLRTAESFKQDHSATEDNLHGSDLVAEDLKTQTVLKQNLSVQDTGGSTLTPLQKQNTADEDVKLEQDDDIRKPLQTVNSFRDLQSPALRNWSSSLDLHLRNATQSDEFDDEVVFNKHKNKCLTEEDDDEQEIIYHRKCLVKKNRPENKIDYEATKIELKKALNQPRKLNENEEEKRVDQTQAQSTPNNVSNENSTDSVYSDETNSSRISENYQEKSLENDGNNTEEYHTPEAKSKLKTESNADKHEERDSTPTNSELYQAEQPSSQFNETSELIEQLSPRSRMCLHHYQMVYGTMGYKSPKSNTDEEST
ncbi:uncharacterized protein LOC133205345 [Saccostrea echinata]|uniref:uncharacterized protein LOC133205345 n=1 Tax=Saccostrea echinata TaxID=191078 RepID=UPI002A7F2A07|nr:uncharacterized protein LOC133205345 [Saccostrea echinata]